MEYVSISSCRHITYTYLSYVYDILLSDGAILDSIVRVTPLKLPENGVNSEYNTGQTSQTTMTIVHTGQYATASCNNTVYYRHVDDLVNTTMNSIAHTQDNSSVHHRSAGPKSCTSHSLHFHLACEATCYTFISQSNTTMDFVGDDQLVFRLRNILYLGKRTKIFMQSQNGPCPLIAIGM